MIKKLTLAERRNVKEAFGAGHPLYQACQDVFTPRSAHLNGVDIEAEEVFYAVAALLDRLMTAKEMEQKAVDGLWTELFKDIRRMKPDATEHDKLQVAHTVFAIVRKLCCHHWSSQFRDTLYDMLGHTISRETGDADKGECEQFQQRLAAHSDELDEWVNAYDTREGLLSEQIEEVMKGKKEKPKRKSGRRAVDVEEITDSFNYMPRIENRNERLQAFYTSLRGRFIDTKTDSKVFINIFQGTATTSKIVWKGKINELHYLFDRLEKMNVVTWPKSFTKWQMVCARFQIRVKRKVGNDSMTNDSYMIEHLKPEQFTSGGRIPQKHDELDKALKVLDKRIEFGKVLDDYLDAFDGEQYDIADRNDALAHGLNTD